ncbi:hypothetical protein [Pseudooceanicola aestuarii]|uniref:hypothetical protein n=1 Tax=Pseudooceanicola aestuarii TaxID=2697319 RepID=UPI0013D59536|nr:hypothetical protein [Pseudooceanicola aestuarii]
MTTYLSEELRAGLEAARKKALKKSSRLRVHVGEERFRVLRMEENGFTVDLEDAPRLRGLVDLYDGGKWLCQCLIVASEEDGSEMRYEFKRNTAATDRAPLDFFRDENAPIALLGSS